MSKLNWIKPGQLHPSIEDLAQGELLWRIAHSDLAQQIRPWLHRRTPVTFAYWAVNLLALGLLVWVGWQRPDRGLAFSHACLGMALGYIVLLPIHEAVHAAAYLLLGYRGVVIRYEWRRFTAYCLADRQVVEAGPFVVVCLAPFLLLNLLLALAFCFAHGTTQVLFGGALLLHIGACSGDVALVNFIWVHRDQRIFTYDDQAQAETHFIGL